MSVKNFRSKEISWLSFNERVLQEAMRDNVPLIERIKFLGIYSNNMDEFFRVRVAVLKRIVQLDKNTVFEGGSPQEILKGVHELVRKQGLMFEQAYRKVIKDLAQENIFIINEKDLSEEQGEFVQRYFHKRVRGKLMPIIINNSRPLPDLADDGIYLAVYLKRNGNRRIQYALIEIPPSLDRFVLLPSKDGKKYVMLLDDVVRYELGNIFYMFKFDEIGAYTFKLTRDAQLDINEDISESYVKKVSKGLELRKEADPVRFVYDELMPEALLNLLLKKLHYSSNSSIIKGGRYHNFKDFIDFPKIGSSNMSYPSLSPIIHRDIEPQSSFFKIISKKDILFHFPYHSFHYFIDYLREASIDPMVREIKLTIYRVGKNAPVIKALINAARNGKKVTAVVELQARFDEKANIKWANRLRSSGVKVVFGVPGLKVHAKLCLVVRKERNQMQNYVCVGTGNFNEDSAVVFADSLLFTKHVGIAKEVVAIFDFFNRHYNIPTFEHLLVAPFIIRESIEGYVDREIENAKAGKEAYIYFKVNNLVDFNLIFKLYDAQRVGVKVRLNVRGMFSVFPEFDEAENAIESIGIIDRFLEHSRIYVFCNGGDEKMYISSADCMTRNLDRRIEVACPIYDKTIKHELKVMLEMQMKDNCSARLLNNEMDNKIREIEGEKEEFRSQLEFYKWLSEARD